MEEQAVADFIAEFTPSPCDDIPTAMELVPTPASATLDHTPTTYLTGPQWTLYVDDASNLRGCGAGLVLISPSGITVEYALRFSFQASNNEAEYEALLAGLRLAKELGAEWINIKINSQLVVYQVTYEYQAQGQHMIAYVQKVKSLISSFQTHSITQIPRTQNT